MLIRWDDCIQETEGIRWKMILECCLKAVEITSSIPFGRLMTKKIILLLVVDRTITDHSQILFHCGDAHRANGVECNIRRMTVLMSSPKEAHWMRNDRY